MRIHDLHELWYENAAGQKWFPKQLEDNPPEGFCYQHYRPACVIRHRVTNVITRQEIVDGSTTWFEDLVLAMTRPTPLQRELQRTRCSDVLAPKLYSLREAILIATIACERCNNVLGYTYGAGFGYCECGPQFHQPDSVRGCQSEEWHEAGTVCIFCEADEVALQALLEAQR